MKSTNKKKIALSLLFVAASTLSLQAITVNFTAQATNGFGDSAGNDLASGSLVEVGIWDTVSSSFILLDGGSSFIDATSPGLLSAGSSDNLNTNGTTAGSQLAFRWFNSVTVGADFGIAYMDKAVNSEWSLKDGLGDGGDAVSNSIDIGDLTNAGATLLAGAQVVRGSFGGTSPLYGVPQFQTSAVPESSTYAALAGLCALGAVMLRRRRA